jgi:hypothetical protein
MLAAVTTEGQAPAISREPGVSLRRLSQGECPGAGKEGVKIAFHAGRVDKQVSRVPINKEQSVRMGNQTSAGIALITLGTVASDTVKGRPKHGKFSELQK